MQDPFFLIELKKRHFCTKIVLYYIQDKFKGIKEDMKPLRFS